MTPVEPGVSRRMTVAVVTAAVVASASGLVWSLWAAGSTDGPLLDAVLGAAVVAALTVTGAVVAFSRPANRVGWTMLAAGTLWALGDAGVDVARTAFSSHPGGAVSTLAVAGSVARGIAWWLVVLGLPLWFPDGRLAGPRWRWVSQGFVAVVVASAVGTLFAADANLVGLDGWRNPLALPDALQPISALLSLGSLAGAVVVTVGSVRQLVARWRVGDALRRQQLRLFVGAAALPVVVGPIALLTGAGGWLFDVAALPLPFAVAFAVLARGLYDLRTAVNRTLVWVVLSGTVAGFYALVLVGVGARFDVSDAAWLPWLAAAVVAVTFAPLRDGLQRAVNRVTFGRWDDPYAVLSSLGRTLEASAGTDAVLHEVVVELGTLGLDRVEILDAQQRSLAGEPGGALDVPLVAYGRPVGTLRYRPPVSPLRARDRRLLDDLARQLGGVLHARALTDDVRAALERLVLAREEERRRLRRDLHDGLGPALAGHLLRLDVIAAEVPTGSPLADDVAALRDDVRATVLDVRRVVEGLRPPALDELGLGGALEQAGRRLTLGTGVVLRVDVAAVGPLPAAVEVAAFRIAAEAMTNVVRHAEAHECVVLVDRVGEQVRLQVRDDGRGLGSPTPGSGLHTMRERAEELGGRLTVATGPEGTTITALLGVGAVPTLEPVGGA
ncbi:sensor histidine kinase [Cellulomonas sp. McL0617]|uniref:sensor histidine kinase n=1 Tax=Cellulomonas sp. McL0617 TaxID=3415675 RepID=UPI003CF47A53